MSAFFAFFASYFGEITAAAAIGVYGLAIVHLVHLDPGELILVGAPPLLINLVLIKNDGGRARRDAKADSTAIRASIDQLIHQVSLLAGQVNKLNEKGKKTVAKVDVLKTPFDFYRALNSARAESKNIIRVMKLHHLGPQDANRDLRARALLPIEVDATQEEISRWYNGLAEWNRTPGRLVERIMTVPSQSMRVFRDQAAELMEGTPYLPHELPWDGELPLMNLCVFDEKQVIITFSTRIGENPYKPIPSISIKSPEVARFMSSYYYDRLVEYTQKSQKLEP